jgi:hypothetical protein
VAVGPPAPWTLTKIQEWASNDFPETFSTVAAIINDLTFQELQDSYRLRNYKNPTVRLAPSTVNQLLLVGKGDMLRFKAEKVFVYVCSEKSGVGYLIHHGGNEYTKLSTEDLPRIDFEEPFSDIGNVASSSSAHKRIRALVLYFYLFKGLIQEIQSFATFPEELKKTCLWVGNGGNKPETLDRYISRTPLGRYISPTPQAERSDTSDTRSHVTTNEENRDEMDSDNLPPLNAVADAMQPSNVKRERESDDEGTSKRQATVPSFYSPHPADTDDFFRLHNHIRNSYMAIRTENRLLIETNLRLTQERDTLQKHLEQKEKEIMGMREASKKAAQWKSQAEAGQAAQKELVEFKKEAANAFSRLMGENSG